MCRKGPGHARDCSFFFFFWVIGFLFARDCCKVSLLSSPCCRISSSPISHMSFRNSFLITLAFLLLYLTYLDYHRLIFWNLVLLFLCNTSVFSSVREIKVRPDWETICIHRSSDICTWGSVSLFCYLGQVMSVMSFNCFMCKIRIIQ